VRRILRSGAAAAVGLLAAWPAAGQAVGEDCLSSIADAAEPLGQVYTVVSLCQGRQRANEVRETFFGSVDDLGLSRGQYRQILTHYYVAVGIAFEDFAECNNDALDRANSAMDSHLAGLDTVNRLCN